MDESADANDLHGKMQKFEREKSGKRPNNELKKSRDNEFPFLDETFEVGARKHKTNADNRKWSSDIADKTNGIRKEAW